MPTAKLTPSHVVYQSDDFVIYKTKENVSVSGSVVEESDFLIGKEISFIGEWRNHSQHGRGFKFESYESPEVDVYYFLTKVVGGISNRTAKLVIDKFKNKIEYTIEYEPRQLMLAGIKQKKIDEIQSAWKNFHHIRSLSKKFLPLGISNHYIRKMYDQWGRDAEAIVLENPYKIADINGFGFKKADLFAVNIGVQKEDPRRLDACLMHFLAEHINSSGNTLISEEAAKEAFLFGLKDDDIQIGDSDFLECKKRLELRREIVIMDGFLTTPKVKQMETYVHECIVDAVAHSDENKIIADIDAYLDRMATENQIVFGKKQKEAIAMINKNHPIVCVCGFAGAGKSTVSKSFLKMFEEKYSKDSIVCGALSGAAANKIKIKSGYQSSTIHFILGVDHDGKFNYHEKNKLPQKVIVIDEASMVNLEMFYHLLKAIDFSHSRLVLLGDPAQIPPVGAGNIFGDIISNQLMPTVLLDKVYRQSDDQNISVIASRIRSGEIPSADEMNTGDFWFINKQIDDYYELKKALSSQDFSRHIDHHADVVLEIMKKSCKKFISIIKEKKNNEEKIICFQVIAPMKSGKLGVENLNSTIQGILNPYTGGPKMTLGKNFLATNDKVMHLHNKEMKTISYDSFEDYLKNKNETLLFDRRVFNGQLGIILKIEEEKGVIFVDYPFEKYIAVYTKKDLMQENSQILGLAYAMSIHKSQGSEFNNVLMPITRSHTHMLTRKLLYTAVTRAKEKMAFVGDYGAFEMACKSSSRHDRKTIINNYFNSEKKDSLEAQQYDKKDFYLKK